MNIRHLELLNLSLPNTTYPIHIGENIISDKSCVTKFIRGQQVLIVSNETVAKFYLKKIKINFNDLQCDEIILPDGEEFKNGESLNQIFYSLHNKKHHRDTCLIALGGGVIGDMTGFAASCYQRGVDFIQIPTTLLAAVDASVGGKTAINFADTKNLIGAFYQPQAVIIDLITLNTLPAREFNSGLAEIIKAALLADNTFFTWLNEKAEAIKNREFNVIAKMIAKSVEIKADIVMADEKEKNIRVLLNLGHTFAHGIEQVTQYKTYLHGEAVAIGLVMAAELSKMLSLLTQHEVNEIKSIIAAFNLPVSLPKAITSEALISSMIMDKKVLQNKIRFIILEKIGKAVINANITKTELLQVCDLVHEQ